MSSYICGSPSAINLKDIFASMRKLQASAVLEINIQERSGGECGKPFRSVFYPLLDGYSPADVNEIVQKEKQGHWASNWHEASRKIHPL